MNLESDKQRGRYLVLIYAVLIVAFIWGVYGSAVSFDFLSWDDDQNVLNNRWLQPGLWWQFWVKPYLCMYLPPVYTAWYGLAKLDAQPNPTFFHAFNVLVHTANTLIVFNLARTNFSIACEDEAENERFQINRVLIASTIAALIFALHPIQVEATAWVTGLRDLLGAFGALLATTLLFKQQQGLKLKILSWLAFLFAMLCKPSAVALPAAVFGLTYLTRVTSLRHAARRSIIWLLTTVPIVWITVTAQTEIADRELAKVSLWQRILVTFDSYSFYLKKWLLPINLTNDYGRKPAVALADPNLIGNISLIIIAGVTVILLRRKLGAKCLAWCFFATVMLAPTSGIVTFPFQHTSTVTDHYFYLSSAGLSLALGCIFYKYLSRIVTLIAALLLAVYIILDLKQLPRWKNDSHMFPAMIAANSNSYAGYTGMAAIAMKDNRRLEALNYLEAAQRIDPDKVDLLANKGLVLNELGRYQEVLAELGRILPAKSILITSPVSAPSISIYYMMLAYAHIRLNQIDQSLPYLCRAQIADPANKDVVGFMPLVLKHLGYQPYDHSVCLKLKSVADWD